MATDKTSYGQSLMHMIKGNLGTGILAMPASFAHTGLVSAIVGLPLLCLIATYCVHLLVKSCQHLESKSKGLTFKYASLAKHSFKSGPNWMKSSSNFMCCLVDCILLIAQIGVCCVYLVFVVDNITSILASHQIKFSKTLVFVTIFPIALLLSYIRTLRRLAIASACANLLQAVGISLIIEYLVRDIANVNMAKRDSFRPLNEAALGFGSAMFAFEGISVVLPIYTRMKHSDRMGGYTGVANVSYIILLILYFTMGFFGYLKFGHQARDSITLNLPPEPIYDGVRALFAISVFLTYPLQFYVPNEIIWNWAKKNFFLEPAGVQHSVIRALEGTPTTLIMQDRQEYIKQQAVEMKKQTTKLAANISDSSKPESAQQQTKSASFVTINNSAEGEQDWQLVRYEYYCRTILVIATFILAISVPKLNLLMDLIGSISGTALSLILPAIIHLAAFWNDTSGSDKVGMVVVDSLIIAFGLVAGASGSFFSLKSIVESFNY